MIEVTPLTLVLLMGASAGLGGASVLLLVALGMFIWKRIAGAIVNKGGK